MMDYRAALAYIYSYTNYERKGVPKYRLAAADLNRMRALLARLGDPQRSFASLLIAGTKGKGSTSAFAESMLKAAGYRTALYTSPHLHSFRERIQIGGQLISESDLVALVERLAPHLEAIPRLTAFEVMTALAFCAFAERDAQIAVVEVGLGGRLDATNVIDPAVAILTPISYDHMQVLGDTLTLIAGEKAGIIRPGAAVVSAPQLPEALAVIQQVCLAQQAELRLVGTGDYRWRPGRATLEGQSFELQGESYDISLLGQHQLANAATALAALDALAARTGLIAPVQARRDGLREARWPGRFEVLGRQPCVVVDSAHNGDSASKLRAALETWFPHRETTLVFGASGDHPYADSLRELLPVAGSLILTASRHERATPPDTLAKVAREAGREGLICPAVPEALSAALQAAGDDGLICVTGSVFVVAEARLAWLELNGLPLPPVDPAL